MAEALFSHTAPPLEEGLVIVSTAVADRIPVIGVGQIIPRFTGIKGKFQDLHTGIAGGFTEGKNLRGQIA
jgi:hypothetical protein